MSFLGNATVNRLNLHYGIHQLAANAGTVFFAVYMLRAGVSAPGVLASIAAILAGRFIIRPHLLGVGVRLGLRALVMAGTLLGALQFPLLAEVHGVNAALFALIATASVSDTVYWTCYHAYFAALGDEENRGRQIGARETLVALTTIIGPLAGGLALAQWGPRVAFGGVAVVQLLSAWPLTRAPDVRVRAGLAQRLSWRSILLFASDGWISAAHQYVWPLALFVTLGQNFTVFGGALALAAAVGAVSGLVLGHHIDAGHGARAAWLACGGFGLALVCCAFSTGHPGSAVLANALRAMMSCLYIPTLMTAIYNQAKQTQCVLRFHIATEGGWDAGCSLGCLLAAGLLALGVNLAHAVLLGLLGVATALSYLRGHYRQEAAAA